MNESTDRRPDIRQRLELYHGIDREKADAIMRDLEHYGLRLEDPMIMDVDDVINDSDDRKATEKAADGRIKSDHAST